MNTSTIKVSCPYCLVGHAEVVSIAHKGQMQIPDMNVPRKCVMCHRYMGLQPRVTIEGVAIDKDGQHVAA